MTWSGCDGRQRRAGEGFSRVQTLSEIRGLLESRGLSPRRALGQNFLVDKNLLGKLVDAAGVRAGDLVLEVGPGTGTLTETLLERASVGTAAAGPAASGAAAAGGARVVAIELDRGLAELLRERLSVFIADGRLQLVEGDCLATGKRLNEEAARLLAGKPFSLVANLPYQAGTALMLELLINHPNCGTMAVTIQREVGERLIASPGSRDYGLLGVVVGAMAQVEWVADLPPECFWPRPEVTSCMVVVRRRAVPATDDAAGLAAFCQRLFSKRRKQLGAILGRSIRWPSGVSATQRPEELDVDQIVGLARAASATDEAAAG